MSISSSNCLNRNVRGMKRFREKKYVTINLLLMVLEFFSKSFQIQNWRTDSNSVEFYNFSRSNCFMFFCEAHL